MLMIDVILSLILLLHYHFKHGVHYFYLIFVTIMHCKIKLALYQSASVFMCLLLCLSIFIAQRMVFWLCWMLFHQCIVCYLV